MDPVKIAENVNRQEVTAEHKASVQCAVSVREQSTVQSIHREISILQLPQQSRLTRKNIFDINKRTQVSCVTGKHRANDTHHGFRLPVGYGAGNWGSHW